MKTRKIVFSLILLSIIAVPILNITTTTIESNPTETIANRNASEQKSAEYQGLVITAEKLVADTKNTTTMKNNTIYLQQYIDTVSNAGGGMVRIPAGTYYFKPAAKNDRGISEYIIKCKDNVIVEGAGTNEKTGTILKPYAPSNKLPVDMFYYNEYADSNGNNKTYLKNADYRNFVIDGEEAVASIYNSAGKGFMINLYENCDWENVVVKNTDGTGFGMDCPINSTIKNCTAINCGKGGKLYTQGLAGGASGFGIGTGYSNNESIYISNCTATGNYKYGFFFEHQGRFSNLYKATKAEGFVVSNCTAKGNMYDFGGERANDVTYEKCVSEKDSRNITPINFVNMSRRIHLVNCKVNQKFTDASNSSTYYYDAVYWAANNAITNGIGNNKFGPTQETTRSQAIELIWRMAERPGDVVYLSGDKLNKQFETGYTDVANNASYVDAVKWAKEQGIISASTKFYPENECTRAQFITMLWRYAGKPIVKTKNNFADVKDGVYYEDAVNWALSKGILTGRNNGKFCPDEACTRAETITFLYRYATKNDKYSITYNLGGGKLAKANQTTYVVGKTITLNNPTKTGYTFTGWTGNNIDTPKLTAKISKSDKGNKTYTANWEPNNYTISFNSNGGTGTMDKQYFIYDDVPQPLLDNSFTRKGYVFSGWNTKADGTGKSFDNGEIIQNLTTRQNVNGTLYAQWTVIKTQYKVEHYKQNIDGTYPSTPEATETLKVNAETRVTPKTKTYKGFTAPNVQTVTVKTDGSTVVKYYYTRNSYSVIVKQGDGIESIKGAKTYKYGEQVTLDATLKDGYENVKWTYNGKEIKSTFTMPAGNVNLQVSAEQIQQETILKIMTKPMIRGVFRLIVWTR